MSTQPGADQATITIEGRTYTVERADDGARGNPEGPVYWLRGPRGAVYFTIRNAHHPDRMFLVNGAGFARSAPGTWLTDKTGELRTL